MPWQIKARQGRADADDRVSQLRPATGQDQRVAVNRGFQNPGVTGNVAHGDEALTVSGGARGFIPGVVAEPDGMEAQPLAALKAKANRQLDGYRRDFGTFVAKATDGELPQQAVAQELGATPLASTQ